MRIDFGAGVKPNNRQTIHTHTCIYKCVRAHLLSLYKSYGNQRMILFFHCQFFDIYFIYCAPH